MIKLNKIQKIGLIIGILNIVFHLVWMNTFGSFQIIERPPIYRTILLSWIYLGSIISIILWIYSFDDKRKHISGFIKGIIITICLLFLVYQYSIPMYIILTLFH